MVLLGVATRLDRGLIRNVGFQAVEIHSRPLLGLDRILTVRGWSHHALVALGDMIRPLVLVVLVLLIAHRSVVVGGVL